MSSSNQQGRGHVVPRHPEPTLIEREMILMLQDIRQRLQQERTEAAAFRVGMRIVLRDLTRKVDLVSENQTHLDQSVTDLQAVFAQQGETLTTIEQEIADLKASPQADSLDFTNLDAAVQSAKDFQARLTGDAPAVTDPVDPNAGT